MHALLVALALAAPTPPASAPTPAPWEGPAFEAPAAALAAAAASLPADGREHLDLLSLSSRARFEADGTLVTSAHFVVRVLSPEGVGVMSFVAVGWPSMLAERPGLRARVVTPGGAEHLLDPATVVESAAGEPSADLLTDRRLLRAPLPAVQVGAVVEVEYRTRAMEPVPGAGQSFAFPVPHERQRLVTLVLDAPAGLPILHGVQAGAGDEPAPVAELAGGRRTLTWRWRDPALRKTPEAGSPEERIDPVLVASTGRSWAAVAGPYRAAVERQLDGQALAALARELAGGATTRDEAAQRILDWVAGNLRYTALELGVAAIVPVAPADVLRRRYGDCKDFSALAVALLRTLGHDAHLALVRASAGDALASVPGLGAFDHAVVRVAGAPALWLDPTVPDLPVGFVPYLLEGKHALVIRPGVQDLEAIPFNPADEDDVDQERVLLLTEYGKATAREVARLGREVSAAERRARRLSSPQQRQQVLEKEARDRLRAEKVTVKAEFVAGRFTEVTEAAGSAWGSATDDAAEARLEPRPLRCAPAPLLPWGEPGRQERTAPLRIEAACRRETRHRVVPASGLRPTGALPAPVLVEEGPFRFEATFAAEAGGAVTARYRLEQRRGELSAAGVARVRAALEPLGQDGPVVGFRRTSLALLEAGRGREALDELRRLIAAEPEKLDHRIHLSLALGRLGLGEAARGAAREAVALAPRSGWAHRVLKTALVADPLGRAYSPGCDRPDAIAAQRRAVELEPDAASTRGFLGQLLLWGDDCRWFGRGADPREAADLLRSSLQVLEDDGRAEDLMQALLATGRSAEAASLARGRRASLRRNAALLAGLVLSQGVASALGEAAKLGPADRGEALRLAALYLARGRNYPLAAALLEAGASGAEGGPRLLSTAEWYRRVRRLPGGDPIAETPEALAAELARAGAGLRTVDALVATARGDQEPGRPRLLAKRIAEGEASFGVPEVIAEVAAAAPTRWEPAGEHGGRLHLGDRAIYAVREGGAWKLLALAGEAALLGEQALAALGSGQPEVARRWLAWGIQAYPEGEYRVAALEALAVGPESPPEALRLLAAALGAPRHGGPDAHATLEAAGSAGPEVVRVAALLSLASLHLGGGRPEQALTAARAAAALAPRSRVALGLEAEALGELGRRQELGRLAARLGQTVPSDAATQRVVAQAAERAGDLELSRELLQDLAEQPRAASADLNNLAWLRLFLGGPLAPARREAQRAVERGDQDPYPELHTLATVLAADGEPAQAIEALRKALENRSAFSPVDDLVVGKVAEAYGLPDAALAAYRRVEAAAEGGGLTSAAALARRWRSALEGRPAR